MKKHLIVGIGLFAVFIVFTVLVQYVDVKTIGRQGSEVGMATVNEAFNKATGYHEGLYKATDIVGYMAFAVIAVFGLLGLWQVISRRSLLKVDKDILLLGGFYVVVLGFYALFEKLVINYRPICAGDETMEASYPSSHTLLFVAVMATAAMQILYRVEKTGMRVALLAICGAIGLFIVIGRTVCGVHWLTDIFGGLLLATSLSWIYYALAFAQKKGYPYSHGSGGRKPMERVYAGPEAKPGMKCVYAGPEYFAKKNGNGQERVENNGQKNEKPKKRKDVTVTADVYAGPAMYEEEQKQS